MFTSIIAFIVVLSVLILVHELGHFLTAKKMGIWVEEFGFGLPPRLFGKKIGETEYSINILPFGGFVKLHGELTEDKITDPARSFLKKSPLIRTLVITAGVVMNFLLAVICFAVVYSIAGIPTDTKTIKVLDVSPGSPAQVSGIIVGDAILEVDGVEVDNVDKFVDVVGEKTGKRIKLKLTDRVVTITPREDPPEGEGPLGVAISTIEITFPPLWKRPFIGIYYGFKDALFWGKTVVTGILGMITGLLKGKIPTEVTGPVGIFNITRQAAQMGIVSLVNLVGVISVNLAVLNILPFPGLDGGRLLFIGIEKFWGRRIIPKVEGIIHTVGIIILLVLIILITISDVKKLFL